MPKEKKKCIDSLRHNEYYDMQNQFDELYDESIRNSKFENLMDIVLSENNILLAYRNIKTNGGSITSGTDGKNINDIARMEPKDVVDKVRFIVRGSKHGYRPKPVRRKEIPKPNGTTRPLGIPCIWDRLIQQCIKQVMEPICEAKFSENSFGFRPNRSVEHAIARTYRMLHMSNLYHVIEFDIKGFFDNVNHSKLIKQIWALGIQDRELIYVIRKILEAPIKMPDGSMVKPEKGTPQGGILSPLLANIVLNELDHWIESQWQYSKVTENYCMRKQPNGSVDRGHGYRAMRTTKLKEMWIVRYADDFRIFCRNAKDAEKTKIAVEKWLKERLKLDISPEKTRIIDARKKSMEFLGFKIKVHKKSKNTKYVVESHISEKALKDKGEKLVNQVKEFCKYQGSDMEAKEVVVYNSMVMGIQNYYRIATNVASDLNRIQNRTYLIMYNRLNTQRGTRLVKKGRTLTEIEKKRYGSSKSLRYIAGTREPIYPIGYVQCTPPIAFNRKICPYTQEGRKIVHDKLGINTRIMYQLMNQKILSRCIEYFDNRISLYSAQYGKCFVTGREFTDVNHIHCHHKVPKSRGGTDKYENLVLLDEDVHTLVHAKRIEIVKEYIDLLKLKMPEIHKINKLRELLELPIIVKKARALYLVINANNPKTDDCTTP
ncbi:MAG: group II intron reverse transcriptase/maturase [Bacteroides sp.]|nr:group II intron reverse transcriptase/maturase [Bacteroides sp.]MCM1236327.1 group II intron reverse transcriptase/maturase [Ruminococcus flavefaciens]